MYRAKNILATVVVLLLSSGAHAEKNRSRAVLEGFLVFSGTKLEDLDRYMKGGARESISTTALGSGVGGPSTFFSAAAPRFTPQQSNTLFSAGSLVLVSGLSLGWLGEHRSQPSKDARVNRSVDFKGTSAFQAFAEMAPSEANSYAFNLAADWDLKHLLIKYGGTEEEKNDLLAKLSVEKTELEKIILTTDVPSKEMRDRVIDRMAAEFVLMRLILNDEAEEDKKAGELRIAALKQKLGDQLQKRRDELEANAVNRRDEAKQNH